MSGHRFTAIVFFMLAGMLIWAAAFGLAYATAALACSLGLSQADAGRAVPVLALAIAAITLVAVALTGLVALTAHRRLRRGAAEAGNGRAFGRSMALMVTFLAVIGITWNGVPALFFYGCT